MELVSTGYGTRGKECKPKSYKTCLPMIHSANRALQVWEDLHSQGDLLERTHKNPANCTSRGTASQFWSPAHRLLSRHHSHQIQWWNYEITYWVAFTPQNQVIAHFTKWGHTQWIGNFRTQWGSKMKTYWTLKHQGKWDHNLWLLFNNHNRILKQL